MALISRITHNLRNRHLPVLPAIEGNFSPNFQILPNVKYSAIQGTFFVRSYRIQAYTVKTRGTNGSPWSRSIELAKWIVRDSRMMRAFTSLHWDFFKFRSREESVASLLRRNALKQPDKKALITDESQLTFKELDEYSNRVADVFSKSSLKGQDAAALFGTSSPQYVGLWVGLSKLRISVALLNNNLQAESLMHSISSVEAKAILVDTELLPQFEMIRTNYADKLIYYYNSDPKAERPSGIPADKWLNKLIAQASPATRFRPKTDLNDILIYVYTSGTTGLPKACIIRERRFMAFSCIVNKCGRIRRDDVIYSPLPLYHTAAGIAAVGQTLIYGATVVVKKKFSAKQFWADVIKYQCTVFTYIGEICRFLLAQPPTDLEKQHKIRMAYGQGLRTALWDEFLTRFKIRDIQEMYGATEGNAGMANVHGKPGAIGYLSPFLGRYVPSPVVIPIDKETGSLIPAENGMYRQVYPGEEGELLGPVTSDPLRRFDGYTDSKAGNSKIVRNVFQKGDKFFRTGDIVTKDEEGFVFFVDRFGDSYRWKGENVSSTEVEGTVSKLWKYADVAVYGVDVPGTDGKAGMLCVAAHESNCNVEKFYEQLSAHLPSYAVPVFIRFTDSIDLTGTFKIPKTRLKQEGFGVDKYKDKTYYLDVKAKMYKTLTSEMLKVINNAQMRF